MKKINSAFNRNSSAVPLENILRNYVKLTELAFWDALNNFSVNSVLFCSKDNDTFNYSLQRNNSSIFLNPVDETEVLRVLRQLRLCRGRNADKTSQICHGRHSPMAYVYSISACKLQCFPKIWKLQKFQFQIIRRKEMILLTAGLFSFYQYFQMSSKK